MPPHFHYFFHYFRRLSLIFLRLWLHFISRHLPMPLLFPSRHFLFASCHICFRHYCRYYAIIFSLYGCYAYHWCFSVISLTAEAIVISFLIYAIGYFGYDIIELRGWWWRHWAPLILTRRQWRTLTSLMMSSIIVIRLPLIFSSFAISLVSLRRHYASYYFDMLILRRCWWDSYVMPCRHCRRRAALFRHMSVDVTSQHYWDATPMLTLYAMLRCHIFDIDAAMPTPCFLRCYLFSMPPYTPDAFSPMMLPCYYFRWYAVTPFTCATLFTPCLIVCRWLLLMLAAHYYWLRAMLDAADADVAFAYAAIRRHMPFFHWLWRYWCWRYFRCHSRLFLLSLAGHYDAAWYFVILRAITPCC